MSATGNESTGKFNSQKYFVVSTYLWLRGFILTENAAFVLKTRAVEKNEGRVRAKMARICLLKEMFCFVKLSVGVTKLREQIPKVCFQDESI